MEWINNNWPVVCLIVLVIGITWRGRGWVSSLDKRFEGLEKSVNEIKDFLQSFFGSTLSIKSPIKLNSLGEEISQELNASKWAKSVAISLILREGDEFKNRSHYEIQKYCFDTVEEKARLTEMEKRVEDSAYKRGLKKQNVLDVLAVELRDALFEQLKMEKDVDY